MQGISSIIRGKHENGAEGAKRPTAGSETREFTSRAEKKRVPPFFERYCAVHFSAAHDTSQRSLSPLSMKFPIVLTSSGGWAILQQRNLGLNWVPFGEFPFAKKAFLPVHPVLVSAFGRRFFPGSHPRSCSLCFSGDCFQKPFTAIA